MRLWWNSFVRPDGMGKPMRVIWSERRPDLFEIHVGLHGSAVLYLNGREIGSGNNILQLTDQAAGMVAGPEDHVRMV
ncbi:hypothetical protein GCM10019059_16830 [Camelimonas fluminis]|nr:hypothetical protein GCM10019059_16830 [Camelimonas fluminis]